ncbi:MAG: 6-carboxytetrahydropterin synthase QueD [Chloroflexi bacterium CG07_land_8_20_14_0_80_51_10]|nr:MAG: 6-carboxytetrahydropterin synthase QueD [Chloroflexi bacterium CG07_land_8_20_14_0_80_51_10]
MYRVSVRQHFDAAHYLRNYPGKCEQLHGHRFQAVVTVEAQELDDAGMAFDFTELKRHLRQILERFDHTCLNDIAPFDKINPSSENIATAIYQELQSRLKEEPVSILSIEVWESPESCVTYVP